MTRAVVVLALLVALTAALEVAGVLRMTDAPPPICTPCHD